MITNKDRSYYIGASDISYVLGNWKSESFARWWMQKLGVDRSNRSTKHTAAGTHWEHRILQHINPDMELDRQIIIEDLRLRVNLDGNDEDTIHEVKTYEYAKGYSLPMKHIQQVQVQMFASGFRRAKIDAYGLVENDYVNYLAEIDPRRLKDFSVPYREDWVNNAYLPRLRYLAECLKEGRFP